MDSELQAVIQLVEQQVLDLEHLVRILGLDQLQQEPLMEVLTLEVHQQEQREERQVVSTLEIQIQRLEILVAQQQEAHQELACLILEAQLHVCV